MPTEITMPQLSDTMTEGTLIKWHKKEGDPVKAGEEIADVETDKATMPMEAFETGTVAALLVGEGQKIKVGDVMAVIALAGEKAEDVKKQSAGRGKQGDKAAGTQAARPPRHTPTAKTASAARPAAPKAFQYDLIVIGGGPAGYAAAIRAGQLKKRVLCVEKENLGGVCLNWGCIPTKALLENGQFIRRLRTEAAEWGVSVSDVKVDFPRIIARSRGIASKLNKGIGHLFRKHEVRHEQGMGQIVGEHRVKIITPTTSREATAENIIIATGARTRSLPGADFDGQKVITSREAMILQKQPASMAIIGAGAIGCEFADFYNAIGTQVTIVEMLDRLLPNEDEDCSVLLERLFAKRGMTIHTKTKTEKLEKMANGIKLHLNGPRGQSAIEAEVVLVAIGVFGNIDGIAAPGVSIETIKNHIKVDSHYKTSMPGVYAVGDVIGPPWLAHVAHHEAVNCVERIFGVSDHKLDYLNTPGCTYTHPQVASMGLTEKKAREEGRQIRVGKFPFSISGRALAEGETDGFVKLIFDARYGELLGVHMIGPNVTELLSELVLAKNLEATEDEILQAMHPHPTLSEAVMEAAGMAAGKAIHL